MAGNLQLHQSVQPGKRPILDPLELVSAQDPGKEGRGESTWVQHSPTHPLGASSDLRTGRKQLGVLVVHRAHPWGAPSPVASLPNLPSCQCHLQHLTGQHSQMLRCCGERLSQSPACRWEAPSRPSPQLREEPTRSVQDEQSWLKCLEIKTQNGALRNKLFKSSGSRALVGWHMLEGTGRPCECHDPRTAPWQRLTSSSWTQTLTRAAHCNVAHGMAGQDGVVQPGRLTPQSPHMSPRLNCCVCSQSCLLCWCHQQGVFTPPILPVWTFP